jgi:YD repeat-containing protein
MTDEYEAISNISNNDYLNNLYGLGHGWSFMFSSIERGEVLHLADGRSIGIRNHALRDYTLNDISLALNNSFTSSGVSSRHALTYKDGKQEFFCNSGKLIGIQDRYGNTISLFHSTLNGRPHISITDTLGRIITISRPNAGEDAMTVSLPMSVSLKYTLGAYSNGGRSISAYEDPMNIITKYYYEVRDGLFNVWQKNISGGGINRFVNLISIEHPTGARTNFTYQAVNKNLGSTGLQQVYRITSREDRLSQGSTDKYNEKLYTYSMYNNSGWGNGHLGLPIYPYPANLPSNFIYSTIVTTPFSGTSVTHTFNNKHLTTSTAINRGTKNVSNRLFEYNTDKLPTKITENVFDYANNSIFIQTIRSFQYDSRGNVTASWSPLADGSTTNTEHRTTYTYNPAFNQLTSVTYKQDANTTITVNYTLDSQNRHPETETVRVNGIQRGRTDWGYDTFGNIISERRYINGDNNANNSIPTIFAYERDAYLSSINTDGVTTSYQYDTLGRLTRSIDPNGNATIYEYNARNDLTRITHSDTTRQQWAYSYTHNYITYTNERGGRTTMRYNALGLLFETIDGAVNIVNNAVVLAPGSTLLSRNTYDSISRLHTTTDLINNSVTTYTYDHLSRVTQVRTAQGSTTLAQENYEYSITNTNPRLFRTQRTILGGTGAPSINTTSYIDNAGREIETGVMFITEFKSTYTYDYLGNMTRYLSARDRQSDRNREFTTEWIYDHAGRVTRETNTLGHSIIYDYDALGRNTGIIDPAGNRTRFHYDKLGRLERQEVPFSGSVSNPTLAETRYTYDAAGNITREETKNNAPGAANTWTRTDYVYNNRNRLTWVYNYNGNSIAMHTNYGYDAMGNLIAQRVGGVLTWYTYNERGHLTAIEDPMGGIESYNRNALGMLTSKTDRRGIVTSYTYDGLGRLTRTQAGANIPANVITQTYTLTGQLRNITSNGITQTNEYDSLGRLIRQEEAGGVVKTYSYDLAGNRLSFTTTINNILQTTTNYTYDELSRLSTVREGNTTIATYTYDSNGNRKSLVTNNGITTDYTYNLANLVTSLINRRGNSILSSYNYTYLLDGNQRTKVDHIGKITTYTYDGLGRLTHELESGVSNPENISYTYDMRGNRAIMNRNGVTTTYTYDNRNRMTRTVSNGVTTNYTYDNNGNQLSGDGTTYTYDNFNRMISSNTGGIITTRIYRPDGLRHSKTTSGVTTIHVWDGSNIAYDNTLGNITKYIRGIGLISCTERWNRDYYLFNAHGDVMQITNSSGVVTKNYDYDAFGVEKNPTMGDRNPWRYAGEYWDAPMVNLTLWQTEMSFYAARSTHGNYPSQQQIIQLPAGMQGTCTLEVIVADMTNDSEAYVSIYAGNRQVFSGDLHNWNKRETVSFQLNGESTLRIVVSFSLLNHGSYGMIDITPTELYRENIATLGQGTYYLRARHYSPRTGRFTQEDPYWNVGNMIFGSDPQDPNGLGRYTPCILNHTSDSRWRS